MRFGGSPLGASASSSEKLRSGGVLLEIEGLSLQDPEIPGFGFIWRRPIKCFHQLAIGC